MIAASPNYAKYLIAKYVPDVRRMEPRNIGVFVWEPGAVSARFLSRDDVSSFVNEPETYDRWVRFWLDKITPDELSYDGKTIPKDSPEYLETLLETQKGNYRIYIGGETLKPVSPAEVADVSDYLFGELVMMKSPRVVAKTKESSHRLQTAMGRIFEDLGIRKHTSLRHNRPFVCRIHSVWHEFKFHHTWGDGPIETVIQRVALNELPSVNHTAFMFEGLNEAKTAELSSKTKRIAVVDTGDPLLTADVAAKRSDLLAHYSTAVVDVAQPDKATDLVASLLGL